MPGPRAEPATRVGWGGVLLWLGLGLALGFSFPYFEQTRNANERPRLLQAVSWVDHGELAIDPRLARRFDVGPDVARSPTDGRLVPNKPPGVTAVLSLAYMNARAVHGTDLTIREFTWWGRLWTGIVPTLLLAWALLVRLTRSHGPAAAGGATCLYVLGTPAFAYAHLAYGHQLAAWLLFVGVMLCIDAFTESASTTRRAAMAASGGALAGAAVLVEYGAAFAAIPLGVWMLARLRSPTHAWLTAAALLGALIPIAVLAAYHDAVFGSPWATGYHHVTNPEFAAKHGQGLLGLGRPRLEAFVVHVLSPQTGLLWWVAPLPFALYGLVKQGARDPEPLRSRARVGLALILLYVLVASSLSFEGGWRVGPRYLVAVLPMLTFGYAEVLAQLRGRTPWWVAVIALGVYATALNVLCGDLWPHIDPEPIQHPLPDLLVPLWDAGVQPYTVAPWLDVRIVIVGTVGLGVFALARNVEVTPTSLLGFAAGIACGLALLAGVMRWPAHPKAERNLAYVRRVWEPSDANEPPASHRVPSPRQ